MATVCRLLDQDVLSIFKTNENRSFANVTSGERQALVNVSQSDCIDIRSTDKGGAVVIQSKEAFQSFFFFFNRLLSCDPTLQFAKERNCFLSKCLEDQLICANEFDSSSETYFYILPKIGL